MNSLLNYYYYIIFFLKGSNLQVVMKDLEIGEQIGLGSYASVFK